MQSIAKGKSSNPIVIFGEMNKEDSAEIRAEASSIIWSAYGGRNFTYCAHHLYPIAKRIKDLVNPSRLYPAANDFAAKDEARIKQFYGKDAKIGSCSAFGLEGDYLNKMIEEWLLDPAKVLFHAAGNGTEGGNRVSLSGLRDGVPYKIRLIIFKINLDFMEEGETKNGLISTQKQLLNELDQLKTSEQKEIFHQKYQNFCCELSDANIPENINQEWRRNTLELDLINSKRQDLELELEHFHSKKINSLEKENLIFVGAITTKLDMTIPWQEVERLQFSNIPGSDPNKQKNFIYAEDSVEVNGAVVRGTSFATPYAAGITSYLSEKYHLNEREVGQILLDTATPIIIDYSSYNKGVEEGDIGFAVPFTWNQIDHGETLPDKIKGPSSVGEMTRDQFLAEVKKGRRIWGQGLLNTKRAEIMCIVARIRNLEKKE
jgi:hypothetical protein